MDRVSAAQAAIADSDGSNGNCDRQGFPQRKSQPSLPSIARKILLVDDDAELRAGLEDQLEGNGFIVRSAGDGEAALESLRVWRPDLIVLDLNMPVVDGWEFRVQQRSETDLADIPLLAISADDSSKAKAIHANGFLKKPFTASQLLSKIEQVVSPEPPPPPRLEERVSSEEIAILRTLAVGMIHEINNPLAVLMGGLDFIESGVTDLATKAGGSSPILADVRSDIDASREAIERLRGLVQDLRALVKKDDGDPRPVGVPGLLDTCVRLIEPCLRGRGQVQKAYSTIPPVRGSESRLGQVFLSGLMAAARAFSRERPWEENAIRIITTTLEDGRGQVEIQSPDRIFQQPNGLALSPARQYCQERGAEVRTGPLVSGGSFFAMTLPSTASTTKQ